MQKEKLQTSIKPLGHKVLLVPETWEEEVTEGALAGFKLTAGSEAEKLEKGGRNKGILVALGPQAYLAFQKALGDDAPDWGAEQGMEVLYSRYAGQTIVDPVTENEFYVVNDEDVLAAYTGEVWND